MSVSVGNDGGQYFVKLSKGKDEAKIPCKSQEEAEQVANTAKMVEAQAAGDAAEAKTNPGTENLPQGPVQGTPDASNKAPVQGAPAPSVTVTNPIQETVPQQSQFVGEKPNAEAINTATLDNTQGKKFQSFA